MHGSFYKTESISEVTREDGKTIKVGDTVYFLNDKFEVRSIRKRPEMGDVLIDLINVSKCLYTSRPDSVEIR